MQFIRAYDAMADERLCYIRPMSNPDLNLLYALEALLAEGGVAAAARRLRLSPSAMSRTLARLRQATGDPLLVRAGRGLVPTPRAQELAGRIAALTHEAAAALRPSQALDLQKLERLFVLRTSDGFVETFGAAIIEQVRRAAPGVRLRFIQKTDKDGKPLRDGDVDLETGVTDGVVSPELRVQALFRDRFVAVARAASAFGGGGADLSGYLAARHIRVSRRPGGGGPVDDALQALGARRDVMVSVSGYSAALALARATDMVATVPERHTAGLRNGLHSFPLPFAVGEVVVSLIWHPRMDADPAHRWLRGQVRAAAAEG